MKDWSWKNNDLKFGGTKKPSPCLNCADRHEGCHSDCPGDKYQTWKAENDAEHAKILEKKKALSDANGHMVITNTRTTGKKPKAY